MPNVEIDGTNSTVKTDVLTSQSGTAITVPTGKVLTVTDAAGLTVAGTKAVAVAPSTSGKVLTSDGTNWTSAVLAVTDASIASDTTISEINLKDYGETTNAIGATGGGTQDINLTLGNSVTATIDAATTFTFSNPTAGDEGCGFTLVLTNGAAYTVTWPAGSILHWAGGTAPTLTASGVDILTFWTINGGTLWHGFAASLDSKSP